MRLLRKLSLSALCFALFLALAAPGVEAADILNFQTLTAVKGPFLGDAYAIRGVPGAGLPWTLEGAQGRLTAAGEVRVEVFGLVLADDPMVPMERRLMNPVGYFRALVSCLAIDEMDPGVVKTVNLMTGQFPASVSGDATIEDVVDLPYPCFAPILFVTSPTGSWFAVTGH